MYKLALLVRYNYTERANQFKGHSVKVLAYQGKSIVSWLIKKQTRSIYSHVAIELDDGRTVIEAWAIGGVCIRKSFNEGHKKGTPVDVFHINKQMSATEAKQAEEFFRDQVGKKYDWKSVFRFLKHKPAVDNDKWFCSELVLTGLARGAVVLQNGRFSEMSPRDTVLSIGLTKANQSRITQ